MFSCFIVFVVLFWLLKNIIFPTCMILIKYYVVAPQNGYMKFIQKSGEWAVVTGATDGIGLEYARQLSKLGMKLFLIGRDEVKLEHTAKELKSYYKTEARYYKTNFCLTNIYEGLRDALKDLDIGVLVNNVGMSQPYPCNFTELPLDLAFLSDIMHCNMLSAVAMTKIIAPKMVDRHRGIIINISSASSIGPMPLSALYSSSKSYLTHFSRTIAHELSGTGVTVQTVRPFFVQTKFIGKFRPPRLFTPTAEEYVASSIRMVGIESDSFGTPSHSIQGMVVSSVPMFVIVFFSHRLHRLRARFLRQE